MRPHFEGLKIFMRAFSRPALFATGMLLFVLPVLAQTPPPPAAPPAPTPQTASPTPPAPGTFGGQNQSIPAGLPWMNPTLDPDRRADMVLGAMTQDEKLALVHGDFGDGAKAGGVDDRRASPSPTDASFAPRAGICGQQPAGALR